MRLRNDDKRWVVSSDEPDAPDNSSGLVWCGLMSEEAKKWWISWWVVWWVGWLVGWWVGGLVSW